MPISAERLLGPQGVDVPGEENRFEYMPRGVAAVIAPWNFPLAILTGMTTAALVTGNTVVMKPAEQSPVIAAKLMEVFGEVGLPPGVLDYLPGRGEIVGARLVEHPDVALIAFTGSRAVGLAIYARAAQIPASGVGGLKHVIAEMGGKNAIIIDDDADLDEAVLATIASAFGYQGQKCSACSRVIVLPGVYNTFVERLVEATRSLQVGPAEDPATSVGPLIDEESVARVRTAIEWGRASGREMLATDVGALAEEGFYVGPHIYAEVPADARLAQEEVFGPVLAVLRGADLDAGAADRQRHGVCADGRHFFARPEKPGACPARVPGRESVSESRHYRRAGGAAAIRRVQDVRHRHEGRRARLSIAIRPAADDHREHATARFLPRPPRTVRPGPRPPIK